MEAYNKKQAAAWEHQLLTHLKPLDLYMEMREEGGARLENISLLTPGVVPRFKCGDALGLGRSELVAFYRKYRPLKQYRVYVDYVGEIWDLLFVKRGYLADRSLGWIMRSCSPEEIARAGQEAEAEAEPEPVKRKTDPKKSDGPSFVFEGNENKVVEPCPTIPEAFRKQERTHLKALDRIGPVKLELASVSLSAHLESNGTFTYDDGEVGFSALNSFELLWHLNQHHIGVPSDAKHLLWGLESRLQMDPNYALRRIFFRPYEFKSLAELIDEVYKDMPPLIPVPVPVPVSASYEEMLVRLETREKDLEAEIRTLEEIVRRQAHIQTLVSRRDELKALLTE
jgi:hypothetical protein